MNLHTLDAAGFACLPPGRVTATMAGTGQFFAMVWQGGVLQGRNQPRVGAPSVGVALAPADPSKSVSDQLAALFALQIFYGLVDAENAGLIGLVGATTIGWYAPNGRRLGVGPIVELVRPLLRDDPSMEVRLGAAVLEQAAYDAAPAPGYGHAYLAGPLVLHSYPSCADDEVSVKGALTHRDDGSFVPGPNFRVFWSPDLDAEQLAMYRALRAADLSHERAVMSVELLAG